MASAESPLHELATAYGVSTSFTDWRGTTVDVPDEAIHEVLAAMGVDAADPAAALLEYETSGWRRLLPPSIVVREGTDVAVLAHIADGARLELELTLEDGTRRPVRYDTGARTTRSVDDMLLTAVPLTLPSELPLGYHTLRGRSGDVSAECTLIVTPRWLGLPPSMGAGTAWGFAAQLYSVRSRASWGVGDVADLTDLAVWSGEELSADYLLINPLHAAEPVAPLEPSPYLPSSRRFFNPLYLRVENVPEFARLSPDDRATIDDIAAEVHRALDDADVIDRDTSWTAKRAALKLIFSVPREPGREADYRAFRELHGDSLRQFATWNALATDHGNDARVWPEPLRDAASAEVADFASAHADDIDFEMWLQWVLDEQLQNAQAAAVDAGMSLGIMHDLAVGVHPGGADAWRLRDAYATGIRVGAPPDAFNQLGQDWQQPPWRPDKLAELAYAPFRDLIANVLRHAGGVRIDHIIGLFRLWWVPASRSPAEGTYVRYNHEALIGVLALEAQRAGAVVVGEDLGVVEDSARAYLLERGILGTSILWFERDENGDPLPAEKWRELCLASVTTHDLPPNAGYLTGEHVRLRDRLGLLTRPVAEEAAADEAERASWLDEIRSRGLLPARKSPGAASTEDTSTENASITETITALHRYLELSPARLLNVALTDAVGDRRTQNQPGTVDEYPNWRIPLSGPDGTPLLLEDVVNSASAAALAAAVSTPRAREDDIPPRPEDDIPPRPEEEIADVARATPDTADHSAR